LFPVAHWLFPVVRFDLFFGHCWSCRVEAVSASPASMPLCRVALGVPLDVRYVGHYII
jgi:hypothetical protein